MTTFLDESQTQSLDEKWQGDEIPMNKDKEHTRIMFHNVNGLSVKGTKGIDAFAHEQTTLQVDIQCFSEHCLDTTKFQITHTTHDILQRHYPGQYSIQLHRVRKQR
jgi:hypothetical protein